MSQGNGCGKEIQKGWEEASIKMAKCVHVWKGKPANRPV